MSEKLAKAFRENVRARMTELGINQTELARKLQVTPSYVSQILSGHRVLGGLDGLEEIAEVLKTDPAELLRSEKNGARKILKNAS